MLRGSVVKIIYNVLLPALERIQALYQLFVVYHTGVVPIYLPVEMCGELWREVAVEQVYVNHRDRLRV